MWVPLELQNKFVHVEMYKFYYDMETIMGNVFFRRSVGNTELCYTAVCFQLDFNHTKNSVQQPDLGHFLLWDVSEWEKAL